MLFSLAQTALALLMALTAALFYVELRKGRQAEAAEAPARADGEAGEVGAGAGRGRLSVWTAQPAIGETPVPPAFPGWALLTEGGLELRRRGGDRSRLGRGGRGRGIEAVERLARQRRLQAGHDLIGHRAGA